jgi:hypothetical protein
VGRVAAIRRRSRYTLQMPLITGQYVIEISGMWEGPLCRDPLSLITFLASAELPKPTQGKPNLGPLQLMSAYESFDAHSFESGAVKRHLHDAFQ